MLQKAAGVGRLQCAVFHHAAFHRSTETPSSVVFPKWQNVGSFIFLKWIVWRVIYCFESEFRGVFFSCFLLTDDLLLDN